MVEPSLIPRDPSSLNNKDKTQQSDEITKRQDDTVETLPVANDDQVDVEDTTATTAQSKNEAKDPKNPSQHPFRISKSTKTTNSPQKESRRNDHDEGTTQLLALAAIAAAAQPQQPGSAVSESTHVSKQTATIPRAPSSLSNNSSSSETSKQKSFRRRGKWTPEEETYVARVIQEFNSGYLPAVPGTTLRSYLSDKLNCDPMRITKKFTGEACIGKRVFHPAIRTLSNAEAFDTAVRELKVLEDNWRRRLELQQRESAKKAAATLPHTDDASSIANVTQTASWLDRAKLALTTTTDIDSVERLIHEGTDHKRLRRATDQEAFVGFLKSVHAKHQD